MCSLSWNERCHTGSKCAGCHGMKDVIQGVNVQAVME